LEQLLRRPIAVQTCPLCSKTVVDHRYTWQQVISHLTGQLLQLINFLALQLDLAVAETGMPEEYRNMTVDILCNDCGVKDQVPFHVVGLKCPNPLCGGYNTRRA
jgi:hypothetical protein